MTDLMEVYKCSVCGIVVEVFHRGAGQLWCCGLPMKLLTENPGQGDQDEHSVNVERSGDTVKVTVGTAPHAMDEDHHIRWIEVIANGQVCRRTLGLDDTPEAVFRLQAEKVKARAYCSVHGLWS